MSAESSAPLTAAAVCGALADDDRRRVFAAVQLGASSLDAVTDVSGLSSPRVATALGRLVDTGLVVSACEGFAVASDALQRAAREALHRPAQDEHGGLPVEAQKVMTAFVVDGRLRSIPATIAKRRIVLDWLAQSFEPGRRYSEAMVNLILGQRHPDTAALRRYLVDEGFMDRDAGHYWRSGGSVPG